ncbi:hypothetical protein GCM10022252_68270 [Streptosporangium oxazolinicum]|uniref:Lipoprotein n=1 Tax=Streptosporangium oxazolinicum TaxID=909287 RepID=A0ABP8BH56_9ACTN
MRFLLAAVLLLLTGCSATTGTTATVETTAPTAPGGTIAPTGARPGDVVIRYVSCGGMTCEGGDSMAVTADGRAVSLRDGELVVVPLPEAELRDLRAGLVASLAGREGTLDRKGGATDQPFAVVTVVDPGGKKHETRLEGTPLAEDEPIVAATERLSKLTARIRSTGTPDPAAPITVTMYEDPSARPIRQATWPEGITTPIEAASGGNFGTRTYQGREATTLRTALGKAGDNVTVTPGGKTLIARWEAVLP